VVGIADTLKKKHTFSGFRHCQSVEVVFNSSANLKNGIFWEGAVVKHFLDRA